MDEQFTTFGTASVMVANLPLADAFDLQEKLEDVEGVQGVAFDETRRALQQRQRALLRHLDYDEDDERCLDALERVKNSLAGYDLYVSTDLGNTQEETIDHEISGHYGLCRHRHCHRAALHLRDLRRGAGPDFDLCGRARAQSGHELHDGQDLVHLQFRDEHLCSWRSPSTTPSSFCNRFKEEHRSPALREAVIVALSKSIPEIGASSLTTIGGLVAMLFMQFKLGPDMALCLIKSILFALLSAFVVMPGLLMLFGPLIDKTGHRSFVPKISFVGKFAYATRHVVPILFVALAVIGCRLSSDCPYAYGYGLISAPKLNETQIAENMIDDNFSTKNLMALVVPRATMTRSAPFSTSLSSTTRSTPRWGFPTSKPWAAICSPTGSRPVSSPS